MRCVQLIGLLALLLALLGNGLVVPAQAATTYYVATNGDDANPGSAERPFRTVQKAVNTVQPGDTVIVRPGVYRERVIRINRTDNSNLPITFTAEPGAILDHSLRISSWTADGGSVYKGTPDFSDPADQQYPDVQKWSQMVVVADQPLERVWSRGEVREGTFYLDLNSGAVFVWAFGGVNPASTTTLVINAKDEPVYYQPGIQLSPSTRHVVFDGFVHRGGGTAIQAGFWEAPVQGQDLTVKNCRIEYNWQYALRFDSWNGAVMDNCTVKQAGLMNWPRGRLQRADDGSFLPDKDGKPYSTNPHIIISWNGDNITVKNSRIHDNHGEAVGPYFDSSGWRILNNIVHDNYSVNIYVDTSEGDVVVDGNLVYNDPAKYRDSKDNPKLRNQAEPDGIRIANEKADKDNNDPTPAVINVTVTNNIVIGTGGGIASWRYPGGRAWLKDSLIANNTVVTSVQHSTGNNALMVWEAENVRVVNNIVVGNNLSVGRSGLGSPVNTGITVANNLVRDAGKLDMQGGVVATGTVVGSPGFVNGTGFDPANYKLSAGSIARDKGLVVSEVTKDYFGLARPQGQRYDIGAAEFTTNPPPTPPGTTPSPVPPGTTPSPMPPGSTPTPQPAPPVTGPARTFLPLVRR